MKIWFHSWRAAIRIARRDAWRSKGRSALVLAMIALPILGVSALDLTFRSSELSPAERADRTIGAADARFKDSGYGGVPIFQDPIGEMNTPAKDYGDMAWPSGSTDVTKTFPAGSTVLTDISGSAKLTTAHGLLLTDIRELKAADPIARGITTLLEGRYPEKNDEVIATSHFLETSGLAVGSTLSARNFDRPYRIVGSYEIPDSLNADQVNALPGAFIAPYTKAVEKAGLQAPGTSTTYLVRKPGGFTWNMVKEINTKSVIVTSRAVMLDPLLPSPRSRSTRRTTGATSNPARWATPPSSPPSAPSSAWRCWRSACSPDPPSRSAPVARAASSVWSVPTAVPAATSGPSC